MRNTFLNKKLNLMARVYKLGSQHSVELIDTNNFISLSFEKKKTQAEAVKRAQEMVKADSRS